MKRNSMNVETSGFVRVPGIKVNEQRISYVN